jgi:prepilin-type N-terminal cleavage/methylation domain-containing protein
MRKVPLALHSGFSLIELLVTICVVALLSAATGPAIVGLNQAGLTNRAISDLSQTLEMARGAAMARNTFVRVGFAALSSESSPARNAPGLVLVVLASADGSLASATETDMADSSKWIMFCPPVVLEDIQMYSKNGLNVNTTQDAVPSDSDFAGFKRILPGISSSAVTFSGCIQFNPSGEVAVSSAGAARYIKVGCDQPISQGNVNMPRNKNPFLLRISGMNGTIETLRKEDLQ